MHSRSPMSRRQHKTHSHRREPRSILDCLRGEKSWCAIKLGNMMKSLSKDGTVRQHDLRTNHRCSAGTCPPPLVTLPHPLSSLALSPLTPYQFVVAGEAPHVSRAPFCSFFFVQRLTNGWLGCQGYLFDRRQLRAGWRMSAGTDDFVNCVRRFGRRKRGPGEVRGGEHITGARVSRSNGHEV